MPAQCEVVPTNHGRNLPLSLIAAVENHGVPLCALPAAALDEAKATDEKTCVRQTTTQEHAGSAEREVLRDGTVRVNVWASPRSLSTVLMYSFAQRSDTVVYDEPLYAHFLRTHPENETWRPYREEVFKTQQDADGDRWIREVALGPTPKRVIYMKHMAKQIRNLDLSFLPKCRNIIQIRTPLHMIPSWNTNLTASLREMGMLDQLQVFSMIRALGQVNDERGRARSNSLIFTIYIYFG
ncbi:unnamed protein product [Ascophyllum nodosum]